MESGAIVDFTIMENQEKPLALERRRKILDILSKQKSVRVEELQEILDVSGNTIRRDLAALEKEGRLKRSSGGAVQRNASDMVQVYRSRAEHQNEEKSIIGAFASTLVSEGQTVIIDAGTTGLELARNLKKRNHIMVVTNSLDVAGELSDSRELTLVMTGGSFDPFSRALTGKTAEDFIRSIRADIAFLSVRALSLEHGLMAHGLNETPIKQAMMASANTTYILADHTKFDRTGLSIISPLPAPVTVISDPELPEETVKRFRNQGLEVIIAKGKDNC